MRRFGGQNWLDYCFTTDEAVGEEKGEGHHCRFCGGGPTNGREDKELEHIVSTHIIQAVENLDEYDAEALEDPQMPAHFVCTEEQYLYARRHIEALKCSLCPRETCLVMRKENVVKHLEAVHKNDPPSERKRELARVCEVMQKKEDWHSFHDEFLYNFPGCCKMG